MAFALQFLRPVAAIIGAALVMLAWSEFVFYNEGPAAKLIETMLHGLFPAILFIADVGLFYVIVSTFLVGLMGLFGSLGSARILLIGALTGYAIEGAVVPAVYEAVPFSYLWTSLAWHGPITVALGIFVLPRLLAQTSAARLALIFLGLGVAWGIWTSWTWADDAFRPINIDVFAQYAVATTAIMIVGYGLLLCAAWPRIILPRWICLILLLPCVVLFIIQGSAVPLFALGLLIILAALGAVLAWLGHGIEDAYAIRLPNMVALIIMPIIAGVTYALIVQFGAPIGAEDLVALVFAVGLTAWIYGVARGVWRHRSARRI